MNIFIRHKTESKRIAQLALKAGILPVDTFNDLYWSSFRKCGKKRKRGKAKYAFTKYYTELYYGTCDYWGEGDEHSVIDFVSDYLFWMVNQIEAEGYKLVEPVIRFHKNIDIINFLKHGIQSGKLQRTRSKKLPFNRVALQNRKKRKGKALRNRRFRN